MALTEKGHGNAVTVAWLLRPNQDILNTID